MNFSSLTLPVSYQLLVTNSDPAGHKIRFPTASICPDWIHVASILVVGLMLLSHSLWRRIILYY